MPCLRREFFVRNNIIGDLTVKDLAQPVHETKWMGIRRPARTGRFLLGRGSAPVPAPLSNTIAGSHGGLPLLH